MFGRKVRFALVVLVALVLGFALADGGNSGSGTGVTPGATVTGEPTP
jgi:hypothetical protein